jgi:hypothetical protein
MSIKWKCESALSFNNHTGKMIKSNGKLGIDYFLEETQK